MKTYVITENQVEGFHCWDDAPPELAFLASRHRHVFYVRCWWKVNHADRQIEIIQQQHQIENYIKDKYGSPAMFANMSCEMIAQEIVSFFDCCKKCIVLEDGMGGAEVVG